MTWIQTHTRKAFDLLNPRPEDVSIEDIAHSLARLCRWTGHTPTHYSVAQHSVLCSILVPADLKLDALLHDATEAYIGDISRPLKAIIGQRIREIEDQIAFVIANVFQIRHPTPQPVKVADSVLLVAECEDLLGGDIYDWTDSFMFPNPFNRISIEPWSIEESEHRFLEEFHQWKRNSPTAPPTTSDAGQDYQTNPSQT